MNWDKLSEVIFGYLEGEQKIKWWGWGTVIFFYAIIITHLIIYFINHGSIK